MAATRRRTTRSGKSTTPRRGPGKKVVVKAPKKKSAPKSGGQKKKPARPRKPIDWKDRGMKAAIGFFVLVNLAFVFFFVRQCAAPPVDSPPAPVQEVVVRPLQIEVLNGCGISGIANQFTDFLRAQGFDVVKTDNYIEGGQVCFTVEETVIIDRRGDIKKARRIARALGMKESLVISQPNEAYLIDASVILGADYKTVPTWHTMESE